MCLRRLGPLAVVVALIGSTACTGGGGAVGISAPCAPASTTGVSGCVTNTRGGPAVDGATISAAGTATVATTDAQGAYTLSLNPGTYDIVASKPGMAASKFQGVVVQAGQTKAANLIMRTVFDPTKPVAAPTISVPNLSPGQIVTGTIPVTVNVTANSNPIREIDMRTSNMNTGPQFSAPDVSTATFSLNSTLLANGPAFVDIITYDLNYNVAEVVINFTVANAASGTPPSTPTGLSLVAVTTGQNLSLFTAQRASTFSQLSIQQDPTLLVVDSQSINLLAAPPDSTLFVTVSWNAVAGVTYKIYRSFSAAGPFVQVAQRSTTTAPQQVYADADPSLAPGLPVYYEVSAVNAGGGESAPTAAVSVTPLAAFNLNLTSPANNATGVSFTLTPPTFTWTPTALVGDHQGYAIYVWGVNDPTFSWRTTGVDPSVPGVIVDSTSIAYGTGGTLLAPLQAGKVYQWDIYAAQAQTVYIQGVSRAVAVANQSSNSATVFNLPTGSLNGPFKLTTTMQ